MKGLQIAEAFWNEWGQPYMQREFPQVSERVAVGRILGSDVLGGDDEISRDHNWGPQFYLWLSEDDYKTYGMALSEALNAAAPNPWKGYRVAGGGDKSVYVESIPAWFGQNLVLERPPQGTEEWKAIMRYESTLYFVRHGAIWFDGTGELSAWRDALHRYPTNIRNARLSEECFRVWQHGEYNFVQRMAKRRDPLPIAICLGEFVSGVMRLRMLMHGDFAPYWKWLAFEFRKLPEASLYVPLLEQLVKSVDMEEQVRLVLEICAHVHQELVACGAVTGQDANPWLLPLLNDANELETRSKQGSPH